MIWLLAQAGDIELFKWAVSSGSGMIVGWALCYLLYKQNMKMQQQVFDTQNQKTDAVVAVQNERLNDVKAQLDTVNSTYKMHLEKEAEIAAAMSSQTTAINGLNTNIGAMNGMLNKIWDAHLATGRVPTTQGGPQT